MLVCERWDLVAPVAPVGSSAVLALFSEFSCLPAGTAKSSQPRPSWIKPPTNVKVRKGFSVYNHIHLTVAHFIGLEF